MGEDQSEVGEGGIGLEVAWAGVRHNLVWPLKQLYEVYLSTGISYSLCDEGNISAFNWGGEDDLQNYLVFIHISSLPKLDVTVIENNSKHQIPHENISCTLNNLVK